jgi:hypothetical protein
MWKARETMSDPEKIPIELFDDLCRRKQFSDGPHVSTFGDGPGEPYMPVRRVWGTLKDGRKVESEKHYGK